jgi:uncharacterized protein YcsI (UPF0317 family)
MALNIAPERAELAHRTPAEMRAMIRRGAWTAATFGCALGYTQANLAILPLEYAFEFLLFCQRNPKPCPILEVTDPGSPEPRQMAPGADLRTDLPKYRIYEHGQLVAEPTDIVDYWRDDLVAFLIGCSFSFEGALLRANVPVRHIEDGKENSAMYITNIACRPAGRFAGPMVVSMRPVPPDKVVRAVQVTSRFPNTHGAPIHIGDPAAIGIKDLSKVDYGEPQRIEPGEVPIFWACGVTPQAVALASKLPFIITHAPSHMFITDVLDEETAVL